MFKTRRHSAFLAGKVLVFERKLTVLATDLQKDTLPHLTLLKQFKQTQKVINSENLQSAISAMQALFGTRFRKFRNRTTSSFQFNLACFCLYFLRVQKVSKCVYYTIKIQFSQ